MIFYFFLRLYKYIWFKKNQNKLTKYIKKKSLLLKEEKKIQMII
jgi:hypothetical protein